MTTYALILPVITMSVEPVCGLEEHTHTDDCYALTCTVEEGSAHVHSLECYEEHTIYICERHEHDENCEPDCPDHVHTDECTETEESLNCSLSTEPHVHTAGCYSLVCGMEEHTHTEECYGQTEVVEAVAEDESYLAKVDVGSVKVDGDIATGAVDIVVRNSVGASLPSTGGMGTTLFYVVGAVLMITASVMLVTKKRMNNV